MGETVNGGKGIPVYQACLIFYYITPTAIYLGSYIDFHCFIQLQTFFLRNRLALNLDNITSEYCQWLQGLEIIFREW